MPLVLHQPQEAKVEEAAMAEELDQVEYDEQEEEGQYQDDEEEEEYDDDEEQYNDDDDDDDDDLEDVFNITIKCHVPARHMWDSCCERIDVYLPKIIPNVVDHVEVDPQDGFRTIYFQKSHAELIRREKNLDHIITHIKERIIQMDAKTFTFQAEVIEGGFLGILMKRYNFTVHVIEGIHPNTCVINCTFLYKALSKKHKLEVPIALKDVIPKSFAGVEAYLLTHKDHFGT